MNNIKLFVPMVYWRLMNRPVTKLVTACHGLKLSSTDGEQLGQSKRIWKKSSED